MEVNSRIHLLKSFLMKKESGMSFQLHTLHNKMEWWRGRIELSLKRQEQCLMSARTMLDEYKTSDQFWVEAVNTACHAINKLYLHKILKKIAYELLTGNKPKVHYFRVFGSKCFILNKKSKSSKFAPKVDEGLCLVMDQTFTPIMFSTKPPVALK